MKFTISIGLCLGIIVACSFGFEQTKALSCTYDNNVFFYNGTYLLNHASTTVPCKRSFVYSLQPNKIIAVILTNVLIDCTSSNLTINDPTDALVYDYCSAKRANLNFFYATSTAQFITINTAGVSSFVLSVWFLNNNGQIATNTPATTRAILPTLASTATCGVPAISPNDANIKIVGGTVAIAHSWPWQVRITDSNYMCGAVLISNSWLVTAAHCTNAMTHSLLKATLGDQTRGVNDGTEQIVSISKVFQHPLYNENANAFEFDYDIALLKLAQPVTFTQYISPICLPSSNIATVGRTGIVTGWGDTKNTAQSSNTLRQTTINIVDLSNCGNTNLNARQICAGIFNTNPPHDSCQGDSGGPFVLKNNNTFYLAGIVSSGYDDCSGRGIYTNVYQFVPWITQTMSSN